MTLQERHAAALEKQMQLSRRYQDVLTEKTQLEQDMLKTAGAIDLLDALIAEQKAADGQ